MISSVEATAALAAISAGTKPVFDDLLSDQHPHHHHHWNGSCDPRVADFWLMSGGPWKLFAFTFAYLAILVAGIRAMRQRAAFELRVPMLLYNITMVCINAFFLCESLRWTRFGSTLLDFRFPSPHDRSPDTMHIIRMFHYYQWTKFIDYLDTFFFILRKKNRQITALHVYHHVSVPFVGYISGFIGPTMPVLGLFTMLNCFCHVLMYSYYALASFGPALQPYLWWKKYITQIQLIQFAIIGAYGLCLNQFHTGYPFVYRMMPLSQAFIFLIMFGKFYVHSYIGSGKKID